MTAEGDLANSGEILSAPFDGYGEFEMNAICFEVCLSLHWYDSGYRLTGKKGTM